jgi:hypothetical protein
MSTRIQQSQLLQSCVLFDIDLYKYGELAPHRVYFDVTLTESDPGIAKWRKFLNSLEDQNQCKVELDQE